MLLDFNDANHSRYKQYHSSIKLFIAAGGNPILAGDLGIPRSTIHSWKKSDFSKLITHPSTGSVRDDLKLFQRFIEDNFAKKRYYLYLYISDTFHSIIDSKNSLTNTLNESKDIILPAIMNVSNVLGVDKTLKIFRISRQRYDMWIKNKFCISSPVGLCVKQHPNQLSTLEINNTKKLFSTITNRHWPLISIYYHGVRNKLISFSLTTFYKYITILGYSHFSKKINKKRHPIGLRAYKPNQYGHADITVFKTLNNTKVYIYLVIDNFSRYILSWRARIEISAQTRGDTLIEAYHNAFCNSTPHTVELVVDGGPENRPIPIDPVVISIKKLVAPQDIVFSNSMIEAANKQLKYRYLFTRNLYDLADTIHYLKQVVPEFNNIRPYGVLKGLTPNEVFNEKLIPGKDNVENQVNRAVAERHEANTKNSCELCKA